MPIVRLLLETGHSCFPGPLNYSSLIISAGTAPSVLLYGCKLTQKCLCLPPEFED